MTGVAVGLIAAVVTTSCGDSGDDGKSAAEADRVVAAAAVLKSTDLDGDFPATGSPLSGVDSNTDQGIWSPALLTCLQVDEASVGPVTAWAVSPAFAKTPVGHGSMVEITHSVDAAKARLAALRKPEAAQCLKNAPGGLWKLGDPDPWDDTQSITEVEALKFPSIGDELVAFRVKVAKRNAAGTAGAGRPWTAWVDLVVARTGRSVAQLALGYAGTGFPSKTANSLTKTVTDRASQTTTAS